MMLEAKNISLQADRQPLFDGLSFAVDDGQALCVSGPEGSGKTLLLKAVMGLQPVQKGHISIDGELLNPTSAEEFRRHEAYVPQCVQLSVDTVRRWQDLLSKLNVNRGHPVSKDALLDEWQQLGIASDCYNRRLADMPPADLRLVALSMAAVTGKSIILADDPVQGFPVEGEQLVAAYLRHLAQRGRTVLVTTRSQSFAELFDRQVNL